MLTNLISFSDLKNIIGILEVNSTVMQLNTAYLRIIIPFLENSCKFYYNEIPDWHSTPNVSDTLEVAYLTRDIKFSSYIARRGSTSILAESMFLSNLSKSIFDVDRLYPR
ncbi:hypothetical protein WA026_019774 [Henosepilachna vigintioctopunctata]|uniref:Uncharacterized protein n=1 Tax=Henosepilachna vigintioctopunctata TaxID=420089 RepID=A0AAW1VF26_9CUCU